MKRPWWATEETRHEFPPATLLHLLSKEDAGRSARAVTEESIHEFPPRPFGLAPALDVPHWPGPVLGSQGVRAVPAVRPQVSVLTRALGWGSAASLWVLCAGAGLESINQKI